MKGRSCSTQLVQIVQSLGNILDNKGQIDILYLDFSKAFDSVPHNLLMYKLKGYGVSGNLCLWLNSYLSNRKQRVLIEGDVSDWLPVASGVPQGSILGPFLFLLYINDLPKCLSTETTVALFADDSKCLQPITSIEDCVTMQNNIDALMNWSKDWGMSFNESKCKVLSITKSNASIDYDYFMNNVVLEKVKSHRDLGINLSYDLSWNSHIDGAVAKANRMLGIIKRTCGYQADFDTCKVLYQSYVRPHLEYGSVVWSAHTKCNLFNLEKVQRRATKFMLHRLVIDSMSYDERLEQCHLLPLLYRRDMLHLFYLGKCLVFNS